MIMQIILFLELQHINKTLPHKSVQIFPFVDHYSLVVYIQVEGYFQVAMYQFVN